MGDINKSGSGAGGYVLVALITAAVVYTFTSQPQPNHPIPLIGNAISPITNVPAPPTQIPVPLPSVTATPVPKPAHLYDSVEGTTYYYSAAVSDEQRKTGKRAPDMLAFWYLGRDGEGQDLILRIENETGQELSSCSRPCKAIHSTNGRTVGFDPGSIIGAAFADAQHGFMKKHIYPKQKVEPEPDYPWPGDQVVPASESPNQ